MYIQCIRTCILLQESLCYEQVLCATVYTSTTNTCTYMYVVNISCTLYTYITTCTCIYMCIYMYMHWRSYIHVYTYVNVCTQWMDVQHSIHVVLLRTSTNIPQRVYVLIIHTCIYTLHFPGVGGDHTCIATPTS